MAACMALQESILSQAARHRRQAKLGKSVKKAADLPFGPVIQQIGAHPATVSEETGKLRLAAFMTRKPFKPAKKNPEKFALHGNQHPSSTVDCVTPTQRRHHMNENTIKGNWEQVKGNVQKKWGELTNDELDQINGNRKILAGKIQEKYGRAQDEAEREIDEFEKSF